MGAIFRGHKRYFVTFVSDKYDRNAYNPETGVYGTYEHDKGYRSNSLKTAKGYISRIKKEYAEDNPREFRVYDVDADIDPKTNFVPVVYFEP